MRGERRGCGVRDAGGSHQPRPQAALCSEFDNSGEVFICSRSRGDTPATGDGAGSYAVAVLAESDT